jgi:RloB-like protein
VAEGQVTEPDYCRALNRHNAAAALNAYKEVGIAFSHPSFDLWLLLHFQSLTTPQGGSSIQVHEKLRGYPAFERFATRTSGSKSIGEARAAQLVPRTEAALRNARVLVKQCTGNGCSPSGGHAADCDPLRRDPSTDVWRLIESLGVVSCRTSTSHL